MYRALGVRVFWLQALGQESGRDRPLGCQKLDAT